MDYWRRTTVELDGLFIGRVNNVADQRLSAQPGIVRVRGLANESGVAVCIQVPAGTQVQVRQGDVVLANTSTAVILQDGQVLARRSSAKIAAPTICPAVSVLQQAILGVDPNAAITPPNIR